MLGTKARTRIPALIFHNDLDRLIFLELPGVPRVIKGRPITSVIVREAKERYLVSFLFEDSKTGKLFVGTASALTLDEVVPTLASLLANGASIGSIKVANKAPISAKFFTDTVVAVSDDGLSIGGVIEIVGKHAKEVAEVVSRYDQALILAEMIVNEVTIDKKALKNMYPLLRDAFVTVINSRKQGKADIPPHIYALFLLAVINLFINPDTAVDAKGTIKFYGINTEEFRKVVDVDKTVSNFYRNPYPLYTHLQTEYSRDIGRLNWDIIDAAFLEIDWRDTIRNILTANTAEQVFVLSLLNAAGVTDVSVSGDSILITPSRGVDDLIAELIGCTKDRGRYVCKAGQVLVAVEETYKKYGSKGYPKNIGALIIYASLIQSGMIYEKRDLSSGHKEYVVKKDVFSPSLGINLRHLTRIVEFMITKRFNEEGFETCASFLSGLLDNSIEVVDYYPKGRDDKYVVKLRHGNNIIYVFLLTRPYIISTAPYPKHMYLRFIGKAVGFRKNSFPSDTVLLRHVGIQVEGGPDVSKVVAYINQYIDRYLFIDDTDRVFIVPREVVEALEKNRDIVLRVMAKFDSSEYNTMVDYLLAGLEEHDEETATIFEKETKTSQPIRFPDEEDIVVILGPSLAFDNFAYLVKYDGKHVYLGLRTINEDALNFATIARDHCEFSRGYIKCPAEVMSKIIREFTQFRYGMITTELLLKMLGALTLPTHRSEVVKGIVNAVLANNKVVIGDKELVSMINELDVLKDAISVLAEFGTDISRGKVEQANRLVETLPALVSTLYELSM